MYFLRYEQVFSIDAENHELKLPHHVDDLTEEELKFKEAEDKKEREEAESKSKALEASVKGV